VYLGEAGSANGAGKNRARRNRTGRNRAERNCAEIRGQRGIIQRTSLLGQIAQRIKVVLGTEL
jgi:hypothetical protein